MDDLPTLLLMLLLGPLLAPERIGDLLRAG
jgi:hypothetical protein